MTDTGVVALARVEMARLAPSYERMRRAIAECSQVDEIARIGDLAVAAQAYYRQSQDTENEVGASRVRVRAEKRMGEILRDMREKGERAKRGDKSAAAADYQTLSQLGIPSERASRAQQLADMPDEEFEAALAQPRVAEPRRILRERRRQDRLTEVRAALPTGRYVVLYADPPWQYEGSVSDNRAIENQYSTMTLEDLFDLPVCDLAADDAVLFCWATSPKLSDALDLIAEWGFEYRTCAVWDKGEIGMGFYFRQQHELLLVAKRGALPPPAPSARPSSVIRSDRPARHSEKPAEARELIERMYPDLPRIELFARQRAAGWDAWGDEAPAA